MFYGVGLYSRGGDLVEKKLSPLYNTAFRAEAFALMKASNLCPSTNNHPIVIFSDSASCLQDMNSYTLKHPWLQEAEKLALANRTAFCWVPGHSGVHGNEKADRLAGAGRALSPENVPVPSSDVIRWTKEKIHESWSIQCPYVRPDRTRLGVLENCRFNRAKVFNALWQYPSP
nr:uncharacterized protein LOC115266903 [Aedes albopictus]